MNIPRTKNPCKYLLALLLLAAPAQAKDIDEDHGGLVLEYALDVEYMRGTGEQVRILGTCESACTLYLSLPATQLCITRNTTFGFHSAYGTTQRGNVEASAYMLNKYPVWVKRWLGYRLDGDLRVMDYTTARRYIRTCR